MKIFITGATGFIGQHLVQKLIQTDHKLYCLVRPTSNVKFLRESGANLINGDLRDKPSLLEGLKNCDWVIHLADFHSAWAPDRHVYSEVNIQGTQNLMEAALEAKASKVVHASTALVYSAIGPHISSNGNGTGRADRTAFIRTKKAGDLIAWKLFQEKGLPLVMVYAGTVVGCNDPNSTGQHIRNLIYRRVRVRAFDEVVSTYVYVNDVVDAIIRALETNNNLGERYLVGKYQYTLADYNKIISKVSGVPLAKIRIPESVAAIGARLFTIMADVAQKPPLFGISSDALRIATTHMVFDGGSTEKALGIKYTDIETALKEAVAFYQTVYKTR